MDAATAPAETASVSLGAALEAVTQVPAAVFDALPAAAQAAVVSRIVPERLRSLDQAGAEAVLAVTQRATNVLAAMQDLALAAGVRCEELDLADLDGGWTDGSEHRPSSVKIVASSVAPLLRLTPRSAESRVADALCLVDELPCTRGMTLEGLLDSRQSRVIVDVAQLVQVGARALYDAAITSVPGLAELTPARLRRLCERTAALIDEGSMEQRAERAVNDRFVRLSPGTDPGMSWWTASLPSYVSMKAWAAIDALAHEYVRADPGRTIDQARADAFADLLLGSAHVTTSVELVVPTFTDAAGAGLGAVVGCEPPAADATPAASQTTPTAEPTTAESSTAAPGVSPTAPTAEPATAEPATAESPDAAPTVSPFAPTDEPTTDEQAPAEHAPADVVDDHVHAGDLVDAAAVEAHGLEHVVGPALAPWTAIGSELAPRGSPALGGLPEQSAVHLLVLQQQEVARREWERLASVMLGRFQLRLGRWRPPSVGVRDPRAGWILSSTLVDILSDPDMRLRVTRADALTGVTVARDPSVYRPNAALARRVRDRDRTCRFPGCSVAAHRCDLDHVVRYPDGPTTEDNLLCLCRTHHGFKHHAGWLLVLDAHGACTWTSPTGRSYVTRPADVRADAA